MSYKCQQQDPISLWNLYAWHAFESIHRMSKSVAVKQMLNTNMLSCGGCICFLVWSCIS